jgi:hypothetical protein
VWEGYGYGSSGISWIAPDTLAFGNGTDGDVSGAAAMTALILFGSQSYYGPYNDYDVDYGPSYDQFYTSIFSGATQNWNLILPPNPGTVGQVLTTNGTGVSYWSTIASSGGSVTSFSSGNLSPLFTTSVATPTTTPVLSFSLNTQNANTVFAGPTSGGAATPTFRSLVAADLPAGTGTVTSVGLATGSGASDALYTISGSPVTTSGTLVETLNTQAKNTFLGGPISGANASPTFRGLNSADIPVPGSTGDVLYNNGGVLGAALTTITAAGSITLPDTQTITWTGSAYSSVGLSQLAADTLAVGNGTESDVSGAMAMTALILYGSSYYSAYDAYQTTILSGALQDWSLVLPETAGTAGQVLTNIGSGFTAWNSPTAFVTSFSSGNLSPLFTTSVATPTTTPALSFSLNTQSPNTVFAGPVSGGAATPTFRALVAADLPAGTTPTPGGSSGDIQYNNAGAFGGSLATITAAGSLTLPDTQVIKWGGSAYSGVGLSQLAADTLAVGNGNESDVSGAMAMTALILYGSSYYSAYDAFQTTILSGATTDWALVLPETSGNAGQVLVNIGSGFTSWESLTTLGVPWSALTNASANLTLANGTFTTTFNQTSNVAWLWANTTAATSSTTNASPLLELAANYWTGSASAQDLWTLGSALGAGTNGKSILSLTHSGSTGSAYLSTNAITTSSAANLILDVNANGGQITFTQQRGTTTVGTLGFGSGGGIEGVSLNVSPQGGTVGMQANFTTQSSATSGSSGILQHFGNNASSLTATSGTVVGVDIGSSPAVAGDGLSGMTFAATSTSSAIVNGLRIAPTINVGAAVSWTGSATMLLVNPTLTATGSGSPVINLMDLQVGGASKYRVDKTGAVFMAAASGAPTSAGTAGTAGEIIYYSGLLYFCSVTGAAGSATWNKLSMTAV